MQTLDPDTEVTFSSRISVAVVQQSVWAVDFESMPLAAGYLVSALRADSAMNSYVDAVIHNFTGVATARDIALKILSEGPPDILAFSVLGWNYRTFASVSETLKQVSPLSWVVFGGNHVSNQGERVLSTIPSVDVVVNGEGESTFCDLVRARLSGRTTDGLAGIAGISFRRSGSVVTTPPRERLTELDEIPSPILSGAVAMTNDSGRFRYDVAIMETNRGCPYKCSFCYWGGAVGQRIRSFSRPRLRAELELIGQHQVETVVLCDANFGMLPGDKDFIEDFVEVKENYGYPKSLEASWAKNKSRIFRQIVEIMSRERVSSSFTIALQTLNVNALRQMNRHNMQLNQWEELVDWLRSQGLDCYAELICGAPGETLDTFTQGYDHLARKVQRIAVYPLMLLPNTTYHEKRSEYGFITSRGADDDFEYVLAHHTAGFDELRRMGQFVFWARLIAESSVFRYLWKPLRLLDVRQSVVLSDLARWCEGDDLPISMVLARLARKPQTAVELSEALTVFFRDEQGKEMLHRWWCESMQSKIPSIFHRFLDDVIRLDLLTLPRLGFTDESGHRVEQATFSYPLADLLLQDAVNLEVPPVPRITIVSIHFREGLDQYLFNHEEAVRFFGKPTEDFGCAT
ncbi:hypothetical protein GCM10028790_20250 [Micromonospora taraxaci]|uniref:Radical SAM superfamily enzyme YgiQ (UPF0313 family) n=1 Tax=Micromonospora taraxaci TaxID=1316803 RepID=A0A561W5C0_9ACTN|nr:KedN5 family methylcobalamin-dependent radical SAM C-methyltransferase [Micromonospora taraxaci]TWG19033.1 radical SAM superfamily enzyme YgiQ (UPF0313 family) [Micromonospora taraxaci]